MKRITLILMTFALAGLAAPFTAVAQDKVVATIDGKRITAGDLAVAESEIGSDMGTMPPEQKRTSLLEFLIDNQLFAESAENEKLAQGPDFETRLNYLR